MISSRGNINEIRAAHPAFRMGAKGLHGWEDKPIRVRMSYVAVSTAVLLLALTLVVEAQVLSNPARTIQIQATSQSTSSPAGAEAQAEKARASGSQDETGSAGEVAAPGASVEPLLREYKGVTLGTSAKDVRTKLGKPDEKSDVMDFFIFSEKERARVYYQDGKVSAIIATYIGKDSGAPTPLAVLGTDIEAKPDGSLYKMVTYPEAGCWVAYSRIPGDSPMVIITMQKTR